MIVIHYALDLTVKNPPLPDMFKLVHYEACAVDKRAVGILLECFLVLIKHSKHTLNLMANFQAFVYKVQISVVCLFLSPCQQQVNN